MEGTAQVTRLHNENGSRKSQIHRGFGPPDHAKKINYKMTRPLSSQSKTCTNLSCIFGMYPDLSPHLQLSLSFST